MDDRALVTMVRLAFAITMLTRMVTFMFTSIAIAAMLALLLLLLLSCFGFVGECTRFQCRCCCPADIR